MGARPEEIRSEIEETRDRISAEIDELTDRYSPGRVAGRKVHGARDAAASMRGKVSRGAGWRWMSPRSSGHLGEGHTGNGEAHAAGARYAAEQGGDKRGGDKPRGARYGGAEPGGDERRRAAAERYRGLLHRRPRGKKAETPAGQSFIIGKTGPPMPGVPGGPEDSARSGKSVYGTSRTASYPYEADPYPEEGGEPIYRDTERAFGPRDPGRFTQGSAGAPGPAAVASTGSAYRSTDPARQPSGPGYDTTFQADAPEHGQRAWTTTTAQSGGRTAEATRRRREDAWAEDVRGQDVRDQEVRGEEVRGDQAEAAHGAREREAKRGHRREIGIAGASVAVGAVGARLVRHPGKREAVLLAAADRKRAYWRPDAGE
ncbi:DUF3618 domain-containing protein [Frankia sp. CNm7]|uniref:DUF3618 domain-containing protein n=1 Tax=Frankia nepalensis TaxID=1836974 RepID=A0A937RR98_9ACTN|nr:DUF3618 domain-containing protein [Frankia nepalensis]MBL7497281.1 DUF3618 domain-containing protein [Frankia nepalensis]MBL7512144.1 DUF3618 domain-containing protein [Frankia nepalensis]MBL7520369.1 DUF3618 domain-containing protein [Frankia nepalensis]MBL7631914.1 DUF3618 domain-containing protein [Frankia nepalensis]